MIREVLSISDSFCRTGNPVRGKMRDERFSVYLFGGTATFIEVVEWKLYRPTFKKVVYSRCLPIQSWKKCVVYNYSVLVVLRWLLVKLLTVTKAIIKTVVLSMFRGCSYVNSTNPPKTFTFNPANGIAPYPISTVPSLGIGRQFKY